MTVMEILQMSVKERRRLSVLSRVKEGDWTLREASQRMGLSYRQAKRIWARYRARGDVGLVHGLRGQAGNRATDRSIRDQAVALYRQHYSDFGCTLACEYLSERHGLKVDDQTLRRWLTQAGLWRRRRRGTVKRHRRARRMRFGELVQLDGSPHDWFEGRRGPCVLMVMVDDATGWTLGRFFESETTVASMTIFRHWAQRYGLAEALYPDRHSIYRVNTKEADEVESRTGKRPRTPFGRAMDELGVQLICARSPQAKGRVERRNGIFQDRLIKALRLAGIDDIESANRFLEEVFLPKFNERFAVEPADETDGHVAVTADQLARSLCVLARRVVGKDQCVSWRGQVLQLQPSKRMVSLSGKKGMVREGLDGSLTVSWRDRLVEHQVLASRPLPTQPAATLLERVSTHRRPWKPPSDHPWRTGLAASNASKEGGTMLPPPLSRFPPLRGGKAPRKYAGGDVTGDTSIERI